MKHYVGLLEDGTEQMRMYCCIVLFYAMSSSPSSRPLVDSAKMRGPQKSSNLNIFKGAILSRLLLFSHESILHHSFSPQNANFFPFLAFHFLGKISEKNITQSPSFSLFLVESQSLDLLVFLILPKRWLLYKTLVSQEL